MNAVNDNSNERYQDDAYYDETQVQDDGQPRPDSHKYMREEKEWHETKLHQLDGAVPP